MHHWLYNIGIYVYGFLVYVISFFSEKASKWVNGRKNWETELNNAIKNHSWIWIHCSSFGEFQDGKCFIDRVKQKYPQHKIILTFFSPSGYDAVCNYTGVDLVMYLPLDTKLNAISFLDILNPVFVFFIRNDIWPNFVIEINNRNIPLFLISMTLSEKSNFFKWPQNKFYKEIFKRFTAIYVQDTFSENAMKKNNFNKNVVVAGNSRVDRIVELYKESIEMNEISEFVDGGFCVILGSSLAKDQEMFLEVYDRLNNQNIKWIVVPHEINEHEMLMVKKRMKNKMICFSSIDSEGTQANLLWINKVGVLAKVYKYAHVAFIGGGFNKIGIHNILEPAIYGCAICFGPNHRNYTEAKELLDSGGAEVIRNVDELSAFILKIESNENLRKEIRANNSSYVLQNKGATERVIKHLVERNFVK